MAAKKEVYIEAELGWSEQKLKEWRGYIDANPLDKTQKQYKRIIIPENFKGLSYYCYFHFRIKENEHHPFYVGVGTNRKGSGKYRRARCRKRNIYWKNLVKNYDYIIVLVKESNSYQEILDFEKDCVDMYGKRCNRSGLLTNIEDGGQGSYGRKMSEKERNKRSLKYKGEGNPNFGKVGSLNPRSIPIYQYDLEGNLINSFESVRIAAKEIGVSHTTIRKAANKGYQCKNTLLKWQALNE